MSEKETVQAELPVLWGAPWVSRHPFHSFKNLIFSPLFHVKLPTDVQVGISSGHLFQRGFTFFYIQEESLVYLKSKNKPDTIRQTHTYTQKKNLSETSKS